jgi:hypothetical protein
MLYITFHPPAESLTDISDGLGAVEPVFVGHNGGINLQDCPESCGLGTSLSARQTGGANSVHDRINHEDNDNVDENSPEKFDAKRIEYTEDWGLR